MSRFFKEPSNWMKVRRQEYMETVGQMNFHKVAITEVKSRLGKNCTFLSHLKSNNKVFFLTHLIINGEKRIVRVNTGKTDTAELQAEDYKALKEQIDSYVTGKKNI